MNDTFNERLQLLREKIAASSDYELKFNIWLENAAGICHDIATSKDESIQVDRFFFAFQSPPIKTPKFLIIAFNSADKDETTYIAGCKNEKRKYEKITGEELKKPNMSWDTHHTWRIWQNLRKSFVSTEMNGLLDSFVFMNLVYFVSKNVQTFQKIKGSRIAQKICTELTNLLVFEIFKPEVILCLGVESFAGISNGFEQSQVNISPINDKVKSKLINQTLIIGVPHSSGSRNEHDDVRVSMGEAIHEKIFKNPITSINRVCTLKTKLDKTIINDLFKHIRSSEILAKLNISEGKEQGGNIRYVIDGLDNDELEITISSQGFIGVRFAMVNGKYSGNVQKNKEIYLELLKSLGFSSDDKGGYWIGRKLIGQYNTTELKNLTDFIENDIKNFIEGILK